MLTRAPHAAPRRLPAAPRRRGGGLATLLLSALALAGCHPAAAPKPAPPPEEQKPSGSMVNASTVVSKNCPDGPKMDARAAQRTIQQLVSPCTAVPNGKAHFSATLLPGGHIELGSPDGNTEGGVVPTCVLKSRLLHSVTLKRPCMLDVELEEHNVTITVAKPNP